MCIHINMITVSHEGKIKGFTKFTYHKSLQFHPTIKILKSLNDKISTSCWLEKKKWNDHKINNSIIKFLCKQCTVLLVHFSSLVLNFGIKCLNKNSTFKNSKNSSHSLGMDCPKNPQNFSDDLLGFFVCLRV